MFSAQGRAQTVTEYQMKAAYLYNLAKFVEWPAETFKTGSDSIGICVLGQSPILPPLNEAVNGETIGDRRVVVRQIPGVQQASGCQIVFVGASDRDDLKSVLRALDGRGTLTVGEEPAFASGGGVVGFRLNADRVQIQINLEAAERQKLRISSKLLSLAQIVKSR